MIPLAERMRANSLKDFIGQENIVGEGFQIVFFMVLQGLEKQL